MVLIVVLTNSKMTRQTGLWAYLSGTVDWYGKRHINYRWGCTLGRGAWTVWNGQASLAMVIVLCSLLYDCEHMRIGCFMFLLLRFPCDDRLEPKSALHSHLLEVALSGHLFHRSGKAANTTCYWSSAKDDTQRAGAFHPSLGLCVYFKITGYLILNRKRLPGICFAAILRANLKNSLWRYTWH